MSKLRRRRGEDAQPDAESGATPEYCFHDSAGGHIVDGGIVTTLVETAMAGACWAMLEENESFQTADLRVDLRAEFLRTTGPSTLRAKGWVVQRSRDVAFCAAELYDDEETLLATARCTQIIRGS